MKILVVGSNSDYAIERYYVKYLKELGAEIYLFPSADTVFGFHSKNIINKILFHSKIYTAYKLVNKELIKIAYNFKPDVIWVFKGMEIYPETLKILGKDFKLANYNPDHPFLYSSRGSGNTNVRNSVGLYNLHFCYHNELMNHIQHEFNIKTVFLPFAYDETDIIYTDQKSLIELNKVGFQGNPDDYRIEQLEILSKSGIEIDVYGIGWRKTKLVKNSKIKLFNIVPRAEFWKLNQIYKVQLNLFRQYNFGSHNMRTFEIPAVGGIELTPFSDEQATFFKEEEEIFFFRNDTEMIEKVKAIISMSQLEIEYLRSAARKRSIESGYTFKNRSKTVLESFKQE